MSLTEKKLKIAFNVRCLSSSKVRGISRYTMEILKHLSDKVDFYFFSDRDIDESLLKGIQYKNIFITKKYNHFYWEQVIVPFQCMKVGIDVYHCPSNYGTPLLLMGKTVVTIHDAIDFKIGKLPLLINFYYFLTKTFSKHFITVSHFSKADIVSCFRINPERITVTYEASQLNLLNPVVSERETREFNLSEDYFFYVGGWEKRKNIKFLINTISQFSAEERPTLVLAGEKNESIYKEIQEYVKNKKLTKSIVLYKWISENQLVSLYREAFCFVYPSLYEGFGLQVCEAMQFNLPVITSDRTALPEILGNDLATFSPIDQMQLMTLMKKVMLNKMFYNSLVDHSNRRKTFFSWDKTAELTFDVYKKMKP